jgi:hypothetical protein
MTSERRAFKGAEIVGKAIHVSKTRLAMEYAPLMRRSVRRSCSCADSPAVSAGRSALARSHKLSQVGLEPTATLENVGLPSVDQSLPFGNRLLMWRWAQGTPALGYGALPTGREGRERRP